MATIRSCSDTVRCEAMTGMANATVYAKQVVVHVQANIPDGVLNNISNLSWLINHGNANSMRHDDN